MDKINLFSFLGSVTYKKDDLSDHPLFQKTYDVFMMNRWLSMHQFTLPYALFLSQKQDITKLAHYKFLFYELPKQFIKFNYKKVEKEGKEDLKLICKYYKVNELKGKEILNLLSEDQINKIKKWEIRK